MVFILSTCLTIADPIIAEHDLDHSVLRGFFNKEQIA